MAFGKKKPRKTIKTRTTRAKSSKGKRGGLLSKQGRAALVMSTVNDTLGIQAVQMASELTSSYVLRRLTGVPRLDIALAGGWPAGAVSVLCGPEGAGKDFLLWRTAARCQAIYGEDFSMAIMLTEFKATF